MPTSMPAPAKPAAVPSHARGTTNASASAGSKAGGVKVKDRDYAKTDDPSVAKAVIVPAVHVEVPALPRQPVSVGAPPPPPTGECSLL